MNILYATLLVIVINGSLLIGIFNAVEMFHRYMDRKSKALGAIK